VRLRGESTHPHLRSIVADAPEHHILDMVKLPASEVLEELRRLKEELPMAVRRAAEAFREDPTRSTLNSATFRKARMADDKVSALRRRIAEMKRA
jgi:chemotaxis response regulator CheB